MKNKEVHKVAKELAREAQIKGICSEWYNYLLHAQSVDQLADLYIGGLDFCMDKNFPSNEFIAKHFKGKMEHKGIYLNDHDSLSSKRRMVLLGDCYSSVMMKGYDASSIYVKNKSTLMLLAKDSAFASITVYDNATVNVLATDNAKVCVYNYGGKVQVDEASTGSIKIVNK